MKNLLKVVLFVLAVGVLSGCARNYYNVPRETVEKRVKVIGVAPFFTDADSDIRHPEKEAIISILKDQNRKNEKELVARLKKGEAFLSVRMPEVPADQLFSTLFFRRERRSDAGIVYNKYFYRQQELRDFLEKNNLDAVMLVVASGLTRRDKIYSSNLMSFLEQDYNYLTLTAQIIDADGSIIWEYPNFQQGLRQLTPLINLQYPDFDEAAANLTNLVDVKFKTVPGITRAFGKPASSATLKGGQVSKLYSDIFDEMADMLRKPMQLPWERERQEPAEQLKPQTSPGVLPSTSVEPKPAEPGKVEMPPVQQKQPVEPLPQTPGSFREETIK